MIFTMKFIRTILGQIRKADQKFSFFNEKDKVLVGISGGKDSMVLLYALNQYRQFKSVNFEIVPAILDLGFPGFDAEPIKDYVASLGLNLQVVDSKEVYEILKAHEEKGLLPCSICSRMKKAAINNLAKELGCNKVAFGHHADDSIETFFMNQIYGGRLATFQPKMYLERAQIEFVRPLIYCHEEQIRRCVEEEKIPVFSSHCPNDGFTMRTEIKNLLDKIYQKYPMAKKNFELMLENPGQEVLYYQDLYLKIERKDLSLHPVHTPQDMLLDNEIRHKLGIDNFDPHRARYIIYKVNRPIGVMSITSNNKVRTICDLEFLRESKKYRQNILHFFEHSIEHFDLADAIFINKSKHTSFYKELGYKKARQGGLIKYLK